MWPLTDLPFDSDAPRFGCALALAFVPFFWGLLFQNVRSTEHCSTSFDNCSQLRKLRCVTPWAHQIQADFSEASPLRSLSRGARNLAEQLLIFACKLCTRGSLAVSPFSSVFCFLPSFGFYDADMPERCSWKYYAYVDIADQSISIHTMPYISIHHNITCHIEK